MQPGPQWFDTVQPARVWMTSSNGWHARTTMCGVPYHSAEAYIGRLIAKGYMVAICEQLEDPALAKMCIRDRAADANMRAVGGRFQQFRQGGGGHAALGGLAADVHFQQDVLHLSLIHISMPAAVGRISRAPASSRRAARARRPRSISWSNTR